MKYDEFAFLNQQLAGMLNTGIPLESALRKLCATMRRGTLRHEFELLEADLAKGIPFSEALASRKLPELYVRMLQVGVESNDLPATLVMLADYYHRSNLLWTRLKAVMVYPVVVLMVACVLSVFLLGVYEAVSTIVAGDPRALADRSWDFIVSAPLLGIIGIAIPPIVFITMTVAALVGLFTPPLRKRLNWVLPGFREASLSRLASCLQLMLKNGSSLKPALALLRNMEAGSPMASEVARWEEKLAQGQTKFSELTTEKGIVPPLFVWLVAAENDDWQTGLARAAELYYARAMHQAEIFLGAALPVSVIFLGILVIVQVVSIVHLLSLQHNFLQLFNFL